MMRNSDRCSAIALGMAAAAAPLAGRSAWAQAAAAEAPERRLRERGIEPPKAMAPVANHVPRFRTGDLVFLAGTGPVRPDGTFAAGKAGKEVSIGEADGHARLTGLSLLPVLRAALGSLDNVACAAKVLGTVNCGREFTEHLEVTNGCSDLFAEVFGDRGRQARSAVGMPYLPFNISVEIEAVFEAA